MFLHLLSLEQRDTFLRAGALLANVDGLDPREAAILEQARLEWSLPADIDVADIHESEVVSALAGMEPLHARNAVLVELAGIAVADEKLADQELRLFQRFSDALGAKPEQAQEALDLARRWKDLANDSDSFMAGG